MSETARKAVLFTFGYAAAGLVAVVVVGLLNYRNQAFHFPEPLLSLILVGLSGALIYASVQMRVAGYAFLVIAVSFAARWALTPSSFSLTAAAIYTVLVGLALTAGAHVQKSLVGIRFGRFICMALILGVGYALMTLLLLIFLNIRLSLGPVWSQAWLGAELGATMGLGFELVDLIGPRPEYQPYAGPPPP